MPAQFRYYVVLVLLSDGGRRETYTTQLRIKQSYTVLGPFAIQSIDAQPRPDGRIVKYGRQLSTRFNYELGVGTDCGRDDLTQQCGRQLISPHITFQKKI